MSYKNLAEQIRSIGGASVVGHVGQSQQFPFYMIKRGTGLKVLLLGGVHGDEPAGPHAIVEFFRYHSGEYESKFEFTAFPCVNPQGYDLFIRGTNPDDDNPQGQINLNREFKKDTAAPEIKLVLPLLEQYIFAMDHHETWPESTRVGTQEPDGEDPSEFYLWEFCRDHSLRVGRKIVENVQRAGLPICEWEKIYGDKNNGGVIWYPEDCGTPCYSSGTSDVFLTSNHTSQAFTIETPRGLELERRVLAHITSLKTVLDVK